MPRHLVIGSAQEAGRHKRVADKVYFRRQGVPTHAALFVDVSALALAENLGFGLLRHSPPLSGSLSSQQMHQESKKADVICLYVIF
jgi:hypothetical protein